MNTSIPNRVFIVLDNRASWPSRLLSSTGTFACLLLCIWISRGSTWWTFFSALLFITFLWTRLAQMIGERQLRFDGIGELAAWVEAQTPLEANPMRRDP